MHKRLSVAITVLGAIGLAAPSGSSPQQRPAQTPTFHAAITLVPLDVRAIDAEGNPVTDLDQSEFTILEDGVAQKIVHFSQHTFAAEEARPGLRARTDVSVFDSAPADFRVFLIIAATGGLSSPWSPTKELLRFIREGLLPQDQVALIANNRATDFTTDHEKVARALAAYGLPSKGPVPSADRGKLTPLTSQGDPLFKDPDVSRGPATNLGFKEYFDAAGEPGNAVEAVRYGIRYMRQLPGEKHIILVVRGIGFGTYESMKRLAADASDARVALDIIHTGEMPSNPGPFLGGSTGLGASMASAGPNIALPVPAAASTSGDPATDGARPLSGRPVDSNVPRAPFVLRGGPVPIPGFNASTLMALSDTRALSRLTGGQASIMEYPDKAVGRIETSSQSYYLLAYSPSNSAWDGRYRSIKVKVSRPGVTVLVRNGYYARDNVPVLDRRKFLTDSRIAAAGAHVEEVSDLPIRASISSITAPTKTAPGEAVVDIWVDASRISLTEADDRYTGSLNVAVFCGDKNGAVVGELRQTVDLALLPATYESTIKDGFRHTAHVTIMRAPRFVKTIVYDYGSDLLGSVLITLPSEKKAP